CRETVSPQPVVALPEIPSSNAPGATDAASHGHSRFPARLSRIRRQRERLFHNKFASDDESVAPVHALTHPSTNSDQPLSVVPLFAAISGASHDSHRQRHQVAIHSGQFSEQLPVLADPDRAPSTPLWPTTLAPHSRSSLRQRAPGWGAI